MCAFQITVTKRYLVIDINIIASNQRFEIIFIVNLDQTRIHAIHQIDLLLFRVRRNVLSILFMEYAIARKQQQ